MKNRAPEKLKSQQKRVKMGATEILKWLSWSSKSHRNLLTSTTLQKSDCEKVKSSRKSRSWDFDLWQSSAGQKSEHEKDRPKKSTILIFKESRPKDHTN